MWRIGNYIIDGKKRREMLMITLQISLVCAIGGSQYKCHFLEKLGGSAALRAAHFIFYFYFPTLTKLSRLHGKLSNAGKVSVQTA